MQNIKVYCDTEKKLSLIRSYENNFGFEILRMPRLRNESVDLLVTADNVDDFKKQLRNNNISFVVIDDDVSKVIRESMSHQKRDNLVKSRTAVGSIDFSSFPRYDEIQSYLQTVDDTRSDIIKYFSLGQSYEGRDIGGMKFSTGGQNKPILLIDAGIHAREWIAPTTALYAIKQLAENSSNRYLFENIDIYIIPLLNPDGYEYTHLSEETRLWRKTRSEIPFTTCKGADANRNFDIEWMSIGASSIPCTSTYAGTRPFSEPEARALRDFILARRDRIKAYLSFHSYGNYFLHPWGFTDALPNNEPVLRCAAEKAVEELSKVRGTTYRIGSSTNVLYPAAGGSDDWTMGIAGVDLAYTVELPGGSFAPSPSEIIPIGVETFEAIKVFAAYVNGQICQNL